MIRTKTTYTGMLNRVTNKNSSDYANYGGNGISISKRWLDSFDNFLEDMGLRPDDMTLDRIDNKGNYCLENCRWADATTQAYNKSVNRKINYNGVDETMLYWEDVTGVPRDILYSRRFKLKWSEYETLFTPMGRRRYIENNKINEIGDVDYYIKKTWISLLSRSLKTSRGGYPVIKLDEAWVNYDKFCESMRQLGLYDTLNKKDYCLVHNFYNFNEMLFTTSTVEAFPNDLVNLLRFGSAAFNGNLGVHYKKGKIHSSLKIDGKTKCLGLFDTEEAASKAYALSKLEDILEKLKLFDFSDEVALENRLVSSVENRL